MTRRFIQIFLRGLSVGALVAVAVLAFASLEQMSDDQTLSWNETLQVDFLSVDAPPEGQEPLASADDAVRILNDWTFTRRAVPPSRCH